MRAAVIGIGGWGKNHLRVLALLRGEGLLDEVYAVDVDESRLSWASRAFGVGTLRGIDGVVSRDVDAAIIATPSPLHYEHATALVEAGIHVLVEKPFTATLGEAIDLLSRARNVVVTTGFLLRFHPGVRYVRERLGQLVGRLVGVRSKRTSRWPSRASDVGVVKDLMIHDFDTVRYVTGEAPKTIYGAVAALEHEYDDFAQALASYGDFAAVFEASWITPFRVRKMEFTGSRGYVEVDFVNDTVTVYGDDGVHSPPIPSEEPLLAMDRNFLLAARNMGGEVVPREDILFALAACEATLRSSAVGAPISVDMLLARP